MRLRPAERTSVDPTPQIVVRYGWRDKPYLKADMCLDCEGYGTRRTTVDGKAFHRTCPSCRGRGHVDVPPAEEKVG